MFIRVDVAKKKASLEEPEDTKRFHVEAPTGTSPVTIANVLRPFGKVDGDHVWISIAAVREAASGRVSAQWQGQFDAMVGYAKTKGWLDESGEHLRAHVKFA